MSIFNLFYFILIMKKTHLLLLLFSLILKNNMLYYKSPNFNLAKNNKIKIFNNKIDYLNYSYNFNSNNLLSTLFKDFNISKFFSILFNPSSNLSLNYLSPIFFHSINSLSIILFIYLPNAKRKFNNINDFNINNKLKLKKQRNLKYKHLNLKLVKILCLKLKLKFNKFNKLNKNKNQNKNNKINNYLKYKNKINNKNSNKINNIIKIRNNNEIINYKRKNRRLIIKIISKFNIISYIFKLIYNKKVNIYPILLRYQYLNSNMFAKAFNKILDGEYKHNKLLNIPYAWTNNFKIREIVLNQYHINKNINIIFNNNIWLNNRLLNGLDKSLIFSLLINRYIIGYKWQYKGKYSKSESNSRAKEYHKLYGIFNKNNYTYNNNNTFNKRGKSDNYDIGFYQGKNKNGLYNINVILSTF